MLDSDLPLRGSLPSFRLGGQRVRLLGRPHNWILKACPLGFGWAGVWVTNQAGCCFGRVSAVPGWFLVPSRFGLPVGDTGLASLGALPGLHLWFAAMIGGLSWPGVTAGLLNCPHSFCVCAGHGLVGLWLAGTVVSGALRCPGSRPVPAGQFAGWSVTCHGLPRRGVAYGARTVCVPVTGKGVCDVC